MKINKKVKYKIKESVTMENNRPLYENQENGSLSEDDTNNNSNNNNNNNINNGNNNNTNNEFVISSGNNQNEDITDTNQNILIYTENPINIEDYEPRINNPNETNDEEQGNNGILDLNEENEHHDENILNNNILDDNDILFNDLPGEEIDNNEPLLNFNFQNINANYGIFKE